jgi:hypothetical protein
MCDIVGLITLARVLASAGGDEMILVDARSEEFEGS